MPVKSVLFFFFEKMSLFLFRCIYLSKESSKVSAVYDAQPNYLRSKPDDMKEESEDKNTDTRLRSGFVYCAEEALKIIAK